MSQSVLSHIPSQTETHIDSLSSSELTELCSALDSLDTDSVDSNNANWAPTPEYHNPLTADDILAFLGKNTEVQEITNMWDRFTSGTHAISTTVQMN